MAKASKKIEEQQSLSTVPYPELVKMATVIASEKDISIEKIFQAIELSIESLARKKYGFADLIRARVNRMTGAISLEHIKMVVEHVEDEYVQMTLKDAQKINADAKIDDVIVIEKLPPIEFDRVAAQSARQGILQKIREAEKERQYNEYKDRVGEIVSGIVKRVEFGNAILDLSGHAEALLSRRNMISRENLDVGSRVRAVIIDVKKDPHGQQIHVSRTSPSFMAGLFSQEVPEVYEGTVEIKAISRDPGSRAKMIVYAVDSSLDPVGACVGFRGSRIQNVIAELGGEKIDVVPYSQDIATLVVNAFVPAEISKVIVDEEERKITVVVRDDKQLSLAIGRRGQNVRLVSQLVNWDIETITEEIEAANKQKEFQEKSEYFAKVLNVDDVISHLLIAEGYSNAEEIVDSPKEELAKIQGFNPDIVEEIYNRASIFVENHRKQIEEEFKVLGITNDLQEFKKLTKDQVIILGKNNVKSLEDLADLADDELIEIFQDGSISAGFARIVIIQARKDLGWFDDEDEEAVMEKTIN